MATEAYNNAEMRWNEQFIGRIELDWLAFGAKKD